MMQPLIILVSNYFDSKLQFVTESVYIGFKLQLRIKFRLKFVTDTSQGGSARLPRFNSDSKRENVKNLGSREKRGSYSLVGVVKGSV